MLLHLLILISEFALPSGILKLVPKRTQFFAEKHKKDDIGNRKQVKDSRIQLLANGKVVFLGGIGSHFLTHAALAVRYIHNEQSEDKQENNFFIHNQSINQKPQIKMAQMLCVNSQLVSSHAAPCPLRCHRQPGHINHLRHRPPIQNFCWCSVKW